VLSWLLPACGSAGGGPETTSTLAPASITPSLTLTKTLTPTLTPVPPTPTPVTPSPTSTRTLTPTMTPTPPPGFVSAFLRPEVSAQAYITGTCQYLQRRWSLDGSRPGTVVVPIMFHGIREAGKPIPEGDHQTISQEYFQDFIAYAKFLGFETITTEQLDGFLQQNALIPPRSMMLIVDDRRDGTIQNHFMPVLEENDWTVTLGWIIADTMDSLWSRMEEMNATGRLDIQSHGYWHRYMVPETPEEEIHEEIFGPVSVLEEHFGKRPIAFVWPGGNFTPLAVETVHEAGYHLAFTAYSRGPLLYNWVPLGEDEQSIGDPIMVLPRFWSTAASVALDMGVQIAGEAQLQAVVSYAEEAAWYRSACGNELPPLEAIFPGAVAPPATITPTP